MTRYNEAMRKTIATIVVGKVIKSQDYDEAGDYYTITLDDGGEFSFRFMADLGGGSVRSEAL